MINKFYEQFLKASGKSDNTIKSYVNNVSLMLNWVGKKDCDIKFVDLIKWQQYLNENGKSTSTIHSKVVAVSHYFNFLKNMGIINENPAENLVTAKVVNKKKHAPEGNMIQDLISSAKNKRDKAMLVVFATTGMRFAEATSVTLEQYNQRKFNIVGKGNKIREIYINDTAKKLCDEYIATRKDNSNLLFVSANGNAVDNSNWCDSLKSCARRAGISFWKEISPHWLRHAFATTASQMGVPVADIGYALGHSDYAKVTSTYIHTPENKVVNIMNAINF